MKIKTGKDLEQAREEIGITIAEMIERLNGVSRGTYNKWEREERRGGELPPYLEPAVKWVALIRDMDLGDPRRIAANVACIAKQSGLTAAGLYELGRQIQALAEMEVNPFKIPKGPVRSPSPILRDAP